MRIIADWHLHSKYSRACSKNLCLEEIDRWAKIKGINLVGTGDFCHPLWFKEIETKLEEIDSTGLYRLKGSQSGVKFILTNEISCIYSQGGKVRRLHICILAPKLDFVKKLIEQLEDRHCNLKADGRPIIGLSAKELLKICLEIDENHLTIPAHAWTPWFAIFGSKSGFDSIEECYGELSSYIYAIETGLSSNPPMNWRLSQLDKVMLVSNSDAHSLENLGREANIWDLTEPSFEEIRRMLKNHDRQKFLSTIEFFPEEGMYHFDGHRECKINWSPEETKKHQGICPVCKKPVTVGVLNRVESLADQKIDEIDRQKFVSYESVIPFREILADVYGVNRASKKVITQYDNIVKLAGNEFSLLLDLSIEEIKKITDSSIAEAIDRMRQGKVELTPGYDGAYGKISLFSKTERQSFGQENLF